VRWLRRHTQSGQRLWSWTRLFVQLAGAIVFLHLIEVSVWAWFYVAQGAMPGVQAALYFSGVTYTTTGYGDLVLPTEWRLLGAVEALTGILMCGWSTAFFVAVVSRALDTRPAPMAGAP
jgi:voltage-gated potassium channel Kch